MKIKAYYRLGNAEGSKPCYSMDEAWLFLKQNFFDHSAKQHVQPNDGAWIQINETMYHMSKVND